MFKVILNYKSSENIDIATKYEVFYSLKWLEDTIFLRYKIGDYNY